MACIENRKGHAFGKPDYDSDHYLPGWGLLVTPDELRYHTFIGEVLSSPNNGQTVTDDQLQFMIDQALFQLEVDLDYHILPRECRYNDPVTGDGSREPRNLPLPPGDATSASPPERRLIREPGYKYDRQSALHNYNFIKLFHHPLRDPDMGGEPIKDIQLRDPVLNTSFPIHAWRRVVDYNDSSIKFFPQTTITYASFPGVPTGAHVRYPYDQAPEAFFIDYDTGYSNARLVPRDLANVIYWMAAIHLLAQWGDAKSPGLASISVGLGGISQSVSTTQSATNALYGAQILFWEKRIKEWRERHEGRYRRAVLGAF